MKQFSKYVGLDVHKASIAVAVADGQSEEVRFLGDIPNTSEAIKNLVKQLRKGADSLSFCYEAGGCGYTIFRQLTELGWDCHVVAPSLIPRKAGDKIKTDRRDSLMLARLHRAGELTPVWVPGLAQEALRDLTRAREDVKLLQRQARQKLHAYLLRYDRIYNGKSNWTNLHYRWLDTLSFANETQHLVFQEYLTLVKTLTARVAALDLQLARSCRASVLWPMIEALMALRGVNLLTAAIVMAEIGDIQRFTNASQLMAYLGLVPREYSSGGSVRRGSITKTGNGHVRRVLVEAAWSYRFVARQSIHLARRSKHLPEVIQEISWSAQKRLCGRYSALNARGKLKVQTCTAVARELAGFIWAIGQVMPALELN